ncbi:MAG TPA: hypothetical protein VFW74_09405 [Acidimicrobiia bacterium]|nr:hypothetical protein [Acidimicrobiia bacterium]
MTTVLPRDTHLAGAWDRDASGWDERIVAVCVATGLVATAVFWFVHRALIDDAYITLSYARNLAFHFHWGLIPQQSANTATSPLFVVLVGGATAVVRNAMLGLGIVFVGTFVALAGWTTRAVVTLRLPTACAVLAVALLLLNPLLLSVVGMETVLLAALVAGLLDATVRERPVRFGVLSGLCLLARIDLVIFAVVIGLASRDVRRRALVVIGTMTAVCAPWFVWSWIHFGSAIPDTFVLKTLQHGFDRYTYADGPLRYLRRFPTGTVVSFLAALLGAASVLIWLAVRVRSRDPDDARLDPVVAVGVAGVAYYAAYSLLDVAPYTWYYGPVVFGLSIALALLVPEIARRVAQRAPRRRRRLLPAISALLAALLLTQAAVVVANGFPWVGTPVVHGNWASATEYERIAKELRTIVGTHTVAGPGEIGTLAYFCRCAIVDAFSDRGRVIAPIELRASRAEPVVRALLDANFRNLDRSQLPRPASYELVFALGWSHGRHVWNVSSLDHFHFHLVRSPADARTMTVLLRGVLPTLPRGDQLVLVGGFGDFGNDDAVANALARAVRERTRLRVRLDPGNVAPWVPHRRYHGARVSQTLTVATGRYLDDVLSHPGTRVVAYWGNGPWGHRVAIKTQSAHLAAMFRASRLGQREYFFDLIALQQALGPDLAVVATS